MTPKIAMIDSRLCGLVSHIGTGQSRAPKPNFLFIGADKSGSTWLHRVLSAHPSCYVPKAKDLYFFDRYYGRGWGWYLRFFRDAPRGATAVGELSHDYLYSSAAAQRIAQDLPDARIVVFLRDPVERAFSEYLYLIRNGLTSASFEQAVRAAPEVLRHSLYAEHLSVYLDRFPRSQVGVFLFEDLVDNPASLADRVFDFLTIPRLNLPEINERSLPAARPRSRLAALGVKRGAQLTRTLGMANVVGVVKSSRVAASLYRPYAPTERPKLAARSRKQLVEYFSSDVRALQLLTGLDLHLWSTGSATTSATGS